MRWVILITFIMIIGNSLIFAADENYQVTNPDGSVTSVDNKGFTEWKEQGQGVGASTVVQVQSGSIGNKTNRVHRLQIGSKMHG